MCTLAITVMSMNYYIIIVEKEKRLQRYRAHINAVATDKSVAAWLLNVLMSIIEVVFYLSRACKNSGTG